MKKISLLILIAFPAFALSSKSAQAQSACNGTVFGIPVCTGFCLDKKDDAKRKEQIKRLRHEADSLNKEANKLSDSLKGGLEINIEPGMHLYSDSLNSRFHIQGNRGSSNEFHFNTPEYRFYDRNLPFNYQIPEQVEPYMVIPKQRENPMKNFEGWYIKKLETAELVK